MNKNEEASRATRKKLMETAKIFFKEKGYAETSLEEIASQTSLTRGALYHHFKNKKELFHQVLMEIQEETENYIEQKASESEDLWEQLILGSVAFVEKATLPENSRILLKDGPNIIGFDEWRKADRENSAESLKEHIFVMKEKDLLEDMEPNLTASMISGALNELALTIAEEDNFELEKVYLAVKVLVSGFKKKTHNYIDII